MLAAMPVALAPRAKDGLRLREAKPALLDPVSTGRNNMAATERPQTTLNFSQQQNTIE